MCVCVKCTTINNCEVRRGGACGINGIHKAAMPTLNESTMTVVLSDAWGPLGKSHAGGIAFDHLMLKLTRNGREGLRALDGCLDCNG